MQLTGELAQDLRRSNHRSLFIVCFLFLTALSIRLYHANEPPINFHATRQYRSLVIARGIYYESQSSIPEWKKQVARINKERQGILEPPIIEALVALGYRLVGGENFWIPRLLSSLFWITGGGFLYLIARKVTEKTSAALFSMAFYLFLPFAVVASRSFQPDPLMIMLLLAGVWAILRFYEQPSHSRSTMAAIISAFAFVVKPGSVFALIGAFIALGISQYGIWRGIINRSFLLFLVITVVPAVTIYAYGTITGQFLVGEAQKTVLPHLLLTPFFWRGWLGNISIVVGYAAFISALLGVLLLRSGMPRTLLIGLWAGYVTFCLTLNYNVATHDYYQLQLIPIVALSLGPVAALISERVHEANPEWYWRIAIGLILALALLLSLAIARASLVNPEYENRVRAAQEIGGLVQHSTNTAYLASDYGLSLEYHGELSGKPWPLASDLEWERLAGVRVRDAKTRFRHMFAEDLPRYFIVQDLREFEQQEDLKVLLAHDYVVLAEHDNYIVYELRLE